MQNQKKPNHGGNPARPQFREKLRAGLTKTGAVMQKIGHVLSEIGSYVFKLRKIFLTIPVVYAALRVAKECWNRLPEVVGINLQASGEYAYMISRSVAIRSSLGITAACLVLMFCSRRTLYPWLISIFTLIIPIILVLTNTYPG